MNYDQFIDPELPEGLKDAWRLHYMAEEFLHECNELYGKDNRSAGRRARNMLLDFNKNMYQRMRDDMLNKMKSIPVNPRKK
jgi:hypothetical protein